MLGMTDKTPWSLRSVGNPSPIEIAMMLLSLLSVIIVLVMTFGRLDKETYRLLFFIDTTICMIFMVNFLLAYSEPGTNSFTCATIGSTSSPVFLPLRRYESLGYFKFCG